MANKPFTPVTIVDILGRMFLKKPNEIAYKFLVDGDAEEANLTYGELNKKSLAIMKRIQSIVDFGSRALLLYPTGLEFITAFCGCLYADVIAVPACVPRPNRPMVKLQEIVKDCQPTIVLTTAALLQNLKTQFTQNLDTSEIHWLATDAIDWDHEISETPDVTALQADKLAFIQYTSGSTGSSKGVKVSHENLLHNEQVIANGFQHTEKTIVAGWLPHYHDMGLVGNLLQPLYMGVLCIFMSPTDFMKRPFLWLQAISRYKATTSGGPNFAYDLCVRKINLEQQTSLDLSSWKVAFNGAEPIRATTLEQFAAKFANCGFCPEAFYPCYGMAETTLFASGALKTEKPILATIQEEALERNEVVYLNEGESGGKVVVGCGKSFPDQQIVIVNPETLCCAPQGQIGEIWLSGKSVAQGYWNRPQETEYTFKAYLADTNERPFLRTGDLGFLKDGELFITGRLKDLIIIRGRNYYPNDIEMTLERCHPAFRVGCSSAFTVEIEGEERLVVAQEVEHEFVRKLDTDQVIADVRQAVLLEHDLLVYDVILLKPGAIPKTSSGKVQRYACRLDFLNGTMSAIRSNSKALKAS